MTHTEIYRAWHSLPEYYKEEVRKDYAKALEARVLDPRNDRIGAHIIFLEKYFGKHNLAAEKEELPKCKQLTNGDKVIILSEPFKGIFGEVSDFFFDEGELFVQVVTKIGEKLIEPRNLELISSNGQNCEKSVENGDCGKEEGVISNLMTEISRLTERVNAMDRRSLCETPLAGLSVATDIQEPRFVPNWLMYRMELAKDVTIAMIRSIGRVEGDEVFEIVDGIVERLKGGQK